MDSSSSSSSSSNTAEFFDAPLHALGFEFDEISAFKVTGRLTVSEKCCQPFKVLHGGVSALIAEGMASIGASAAIGFKRVAGIQLSIHHLKPAVLGDRIFAEASPVGTGKTIQVWEVRLWKMSESDETKNKIMVSSSRLTLFCNLQIPDDSKDVSAYLKRFASKL